jgi:16S rRNA C967 or C1407 C5-methylase (RsmB/RsmF family)
VSFWINIVAKFVSVYYSGIGVLMTEPLYEGPSLSDTSVDMIFPQNLPSIVCSHVLDPQSGEIILDMCAAPGK